MFGLKEYIRKCVKEYLIELAKNDPQEKIKLHAFVSKEWIKQKSDNSSFNTFLPYLNFPFESLDLEFKMHFGIQNKDQKIKCKSWADLNKFCRELSENPREVWDGKEYLEGISNIKIYYWYKSLGDRQLETWYIGGVSNSKIYYVDDFGKICKMICDSLEPYPELLL